MATASAQPDTDFLDVVCAFEPTYVPWLDRSTALSRLTAVGLPRARTESWKYTDPARLLAIDSSEPNGATPIDSTGEVEVMPFESEQARGLIEQYLDTLLDHSRMPLAAVNSALLDFGVVLRARENQSGRVRIHDLPGNYQRILVIAEPDSSIEIVETTTHANRTIECWVGHGANVRMRRLQNETEIVDYNALAVTIASAGSFDFAQYSLGAQLRRNDIAVNLRGEGASATLAGAWRLTGTQHLDNQLAINHEIGGGTSRQHFRGNVTDKSKAVFNGRIYIAEDAQRSDATLTNRNILESADAEVYAKPELEIYANDVVCSHGATVGQLDRDALFYLRSRGLSYADARTLLVRGFLGAAVAHDDGRELLGIATPAISAPASQP